MGKRSNYKRRANDDYPTTDSKVIPPLLPFIRGTTAFVEPCSGEGELIKLLEEQGKICVYSGDITRGQDAFDLDMDILRARTIITNPPWTRNILHPMIEHFCKYTESWLLFDADWAHTKQAIPYLDYCRRIVSVGRVKWFPDSDATGKDNCAWYNFKPYKTVSTLFYGNRKYD